MWLNYEDKPSTITFGALPSGSTNGPSYSHDIVTSGYYGTWWTVELGGLYYNGGMLNQEAGSPITNAIIDSGTSYMLIG